MTPIVLFLALLAPADLPKGEAVLARYIEVTGGRAAYEQIHGSISTGTMALSGQNIKGTITVYEAEPAKQVTIAEFPGIGKMEEGTNGTLAWSFSALQGARLKEGEEKDLAIRTANGELKFLDWKKYYKSVDNTGLEDVAGKPAYKVVLTPIAGKPETEYYDKSSGLLVKQTASVATPMGDVGVQTLMSDYRKDGAILRPHKLQQTAAGQSFEINILTFTPNPEFPKDRFDPPAEVKALIK